jgi:acetyl esterase/lipase
MTTMEGSKVVLGINAVSDGRLRLWPDEYEELRAEVAQAVSAVLAANPQPPPSTDPGLLLERGRQMMAQMDSMLPDVEGAEGRDIAGVPCRVVRTPGATRGVYLTIHGGGLSFGSARHGDTANAALSARHGVTVVSVDYRLTPDHPYPAAPDDCFAVARWLLDGGAAELGSDRLLIAGESAGAYLAAVTLLRVRDELDAADRIAGANLIFGIYDIAGTPSQFGVRPSKAFDILDPVGLGFVRDWYTPGMTSDERRDPAISPLYADLHGLPPAIFSVGTADHVLDDSVFMAARWAATGNVAELGVYPECPHGFLALPVELARRGQARIDAFIEDRLR